MWSSFGHGLRTTDYDNKTFLAFRAALDYGEKVHRSVNNPNPREDYSRQWLVWGTKWKNAIPNNTSSWSNLKATFLVRGFEVAREP